MTRKIIVPSKFNLDALFNSYNFLVLNLHAQNLSPILADNMHAPNCLFEHCIIICSSGLMFCSQTDIYLFVGFNILFVKRYAFVRSSI